MPKLDDELGPRFPVSNNQEKNRVIVFFLNKHFIERPVRYYVYKFANFVILIFVKIKIVCLVVSSFFSKMLISQTNELLFFVLIPGFVTNWATP